MQNSTTEIQVHCQRYAAVLQQVQANTLAQLGSNPLKPLLRATADPTTPSEASENGSILERKSLHFILLPPDIKNRVMGMEVSQHIKNYFAIAFCLALQSILKTWLRFQSA